MSNYLTSYEATTYWVYRNDKPIYRTANDKLARTRFEKERNENPHMLIEVRRSVMTNTLMYQSTPIVEKDRERQERRASSANY